MKKYAALLVVLSAIALIFIFRNSVIGVVQIIRDQGAVGVYYRVKDKLPITWPNVSWDSGLPSAVGMNASSLARMSNTLADRQTRALLIARHGKLVHEYYAPGHTVNELFHIAAMSKGVTAAMAASFLIADGSLDLDEHLSEYIESWQSDPVRREISVRHVLTHSTGIENVSFTREQAGWKKRYLDNPDQRFELVINDIPLNFSPGSRYSYSGVAFYALAYAMGDVLRDSRHAHVRELLWKRMVKPLGIPLHDWAISYSESYRIDEMELYAIGSGGQFTARALARIGQMLLDEGLYRDRQILPPASVALLLGYGGSPKVPEPNSSNPPAGLGVWLNCNGFWPNIPRDVVIAAGGGHQLLIIIPSLDTLIVRLGGPLGEDRWEGDYWRALEPTIFEPLLEALGDPEIATDENFTCGAA